MFFNYLFYIILFLGFVLPTNGSYFLPFPGILLSLNEIAFLLLPVVNIFCFSKNRNVVKNIQIRELILAFLFVILFTEVVVKYVAFNQSLGNAFKSIRIAFPLLSSLVLVYFGIRADITKVWNVLLIAVGCSVVISLLSLVINLPIYYNQEEGVDVLTRARGRIGNSNASFGVIGLYLLFKDHGKWYNNSKLVKYVSVLSVVALILSFNRTYLVILTLEFLILAFTTFSKRTLRMTFFIPLLFLCIGFTAYTASDAIKAQVDRRILSIIFQETTVVESTVEGNRDIIYDGVMDRIEEGYWVVGLPYTVGIFSYTNFLLGDVEAAKTDVSFVNVLLRFGCVPFFLFCAILKCLVKRLRFQVLVVSLYVLASLNIDSLVNHNSIFFLVVFGLVYNYTSNAKSPYYNKHITHT